MKNDVVFVSLANLSRHVVVFVLSIFLARLLSKSGYGSYIQMMMVTTFVSEFTLIGIPASIFYFYPKVARKREFIRLLIATLFTLSIVSSMSIYLLAEKISIFINNESLSSYALFMAGFVFFQMNIRLFEPFMIVAGRTKIFFVIETLFSAIFFLSVLIPLLMGWGLYAIFMAMVFGQMLQLASVIVAVYHVQSNIEDGQSGEKTSIKDLLRYCLPIGGALSVVEIGRIADKIVVSKLFSQAELAVYARGVTTIPFISVVVNSVCNILLPKMVIAHSEGNINLLLQKWHVAVRLVAVIVFPVTLFLVFSAEAVITLLFSEKYIDSAPIFQVFSLHMLVTITSFDLVVRAIGRTQDMLKVNAMYALLQASLSLTMISLFGLMGGAVASVIVTFLFASMHIWNIRRILHVSLRESFPWYDLSKILFASLATIIMVLLVMTIFNLKNMYGEFFVSGCLFVGIYLLIVKYGTILNREDRSMMKEVLPTKLRRLF